MSKDTKDILQALAEYKQTAEGRALRVRLDLTPIVIRHLERRGWSPEDLARAARIDTHNVDEILYSDYNYTTETMGRILFALDAHVKLVEVEKT